MDARNENERDRPKKTAVERRSDREVVVTHLCNGPARLVFEAWTNPALFQRWWVPKSAGITLLSCEMDVRTGGTYRLAFAHGQGEMVFFGRYLEVVPLKRIVWSNDESGEAGATTTVTFEEKGEQTLVVVRDLYPSKEACDASAGSADGMPETFAQLDELLVSQTR